VKKRTVLVVAHLQQASPRIPGLATYLLEYGWKVVVLTPRPIPASYAGWRIVETPYPRVLDSWKRLLGFDSNKELRGQIKNRLHLHPRRSVLDPVLGLIGEIVNYPDAEKHWRPVALNAADVLARREDIAAVISSSPPVTAHVIGNELRARFSYPWIADLRDLWSQNHSYGYSSLRRLVDRRLELSTLLAADVLVTASQPWAEKLRLLHNGKSTCAITNGFDPIHLNGRRTEQPTKFTITYTGSIYPSYQDLSKLFLALRELIQDGTIDPARIEVRFYSPPAKWLEQEVVEAGLEDIVTQNGMVSHEAALQKQRESHLLLLLNWEDVGEKGCYPLKTFEYLAAKRPVLAIGGSGDDVVTDLLNETQAGRSCPDVDTIRQYLRESYREFQNSGTVGCSGNGSRILRYSYREMAAQFAEILDRVTRGDLV